MSDKEGESIDDSDPFDGEDLGEFRDVGPAVVLDRPVPPRLRAVWNGDAETVARVVPPAPHGLGMPRPGAVGFDNFYLTYQPALFAKLIRFCAGDRDLAEDVVQETFLAAYRRRDQLSELVDPAGWLYVVATRAAMKFFTRETPGEEHGPEDSASEGGLDETSIVLSDLLHRVLSQEERLIIEYRYLLGHRRQWIADRMGLKLRTVDNRIAMALAKLRAHLAQSEGDQS